MSSLPVSAEVCVIGCGPAGAVISTRLAQMGHDVVLLAARSPGREHIGAATLPPEALAILGTLGVREHVENAGFIRSAGNAVLWEQDRPSLRSRNGPNGLHVERRRFDQILIDFACVEGSRIISPARALVPARTGDGWLIELKGHPHFHSLRARFVVDASGGRCLPDGQRSRHSAPTIAIYGHWRTSGDVCRVGCVEAGVEEWMWCAPVTKDSIAVALFLDPARVYFGKKAAAELFLQRLRSSRLVGRVLRDGAPGPISVCDASIRASTPAVGVDFLRVGDANLRVDPLSSQGILIGISSALQGAVVINTILRHPHNADAAIEFYNIKQSARLKQHCITSAGFYHNMLAKHDNAFWRSRAVAAFSTSQRQPRSDAIDLDRRVVLSANARIENTPVVLGDEIQMRFALAHDELDAPTAFLGNVYLPPLLESIHSGRRAASILKDWSTLYPPDLCRQIMDWLWRHNIVQTI
jgi:flavin-dependent dehydrogenase